MALFTGYFSVSDDHKHNCNQLLELRDFWQVAGNCFLNCLILLEIITRLYLQAAESLLYVYYYT